MYNNSKRKRNKCEQVVPGTLGANKVQSDVRSLSSNFPHSSPSNDPDYPIPDFQRVYSRMRDGENGLQVMDRRWRLIWHPKCFVGSEAVKWMMKNMSLDKIQSVSTGQRLMDAGFIQHVRHSEPFCDAPYFYRFQEDEDTNILNLKRIWDPSVPTPDAVEVSKELLTRLACLCEEFRKRILDTDLKSPSLSSDSVPPKDCTTSPLLTGTAGPRLSGPIIPVSTSSSTPDLSRTSISPLPAAQAISPLMGSTPNISTARSAPAIVNAVSEEVDYSTLAKSEDFRQYTLSAAVLQRVQVVALNHEERIAFFVNIYNTLCLHAHVVHGAPTTLFRRYTFFRALCYRIGGLDLTLDDIEHGILRGNKRPPKIPFLQLGASDPKCQHVLTKRDGRIHFVISAGTRSDPPIRILDGDTTEDDLHIATYDFLWNTVKIDVQKRTVTLPRIFSWYAEDFPFAGKHLLRWVAQYLPAREANHMEALVSSGDALPTVVYENFDWTKPEARFSAQVVQRKRRKLERERSNSFQMANSGDLFEVVLPITARTNGLAPIISPDPFASRTSIPQSNPASNPNSPALGLGGGTPARESRVASSATPMLPLNSSTLSNSPSEETTNVSGAAEGAGVIVKSEFPGMETLIDKR